MDVIDRLIAILASALLDGVATINQGSTALTKSGAIWAATALPLWSSSLITYSVLFLDVTGQNHLSRTE